LGLTIFVWIYWIFERIWEIQTKIREQSKQTSSFLVDLQFNKHFSANSILATLFSEKYISATIFLSK
jgi:hypothetical protein